MSRSLPRGVLPGVRRALEEEAGPGVEILEARGGSGGCVNPSLHLDLSDGSRAFLKWNREVPDLFPAEAEGLRALRAGGHLRVPEVLGVGRGQKGGAGWLLLEFVEEGAPGPDYGRRLGEGLAALHRPRREEDPGWGRDNFIGPLPQSNRPRSSWAEFWREERILPQLRRAREKGHLRSPEDSRLWDRHLDDLPRLLEGAGEDGPSLLHGDLWGGNAYPDTRGEPVLIDPAVYRGHREVDLAMMELFGGFPGSFRRSYRNALPLIPGYEEGRRDVYQLYYLLVHVNLFGEGYLSRTRTALRRALEA